MREALTRRPDEAEAAFAAAEEAGLVLAEAFMWRHHPQALRLRELLEAAVVGEVRLVRAAFSFASVRPGDVRLQAGLDGGALMDVGCYCVSGLRLVLGEPVAVAGRQVLGGDGVDVRFAGTMAFAGGALGVFDCGLDVFRRAELEVVGTEGALFLPGSVDRAGAGDRGAACRRCRADRDRGGRRVRVRAARPRRGGAGGAPPRFGREDAVGQAAVIAALYESAASGTRRRARAGRGRPSATEGTAHRARERAGLRGETQGVARPSGPIARGRPRRAGRTAARTRLPARGRA